MIATISGFENRLIKSTRFPHVTPLRVCVARIHRVRRAIRVPLPCHNASVTALRQHAVAAFLVVERALQAW
jgi:hypothetical protein